MITRILLAAFCLAFAFGCSTTGNSNGETARYGSNIEVDNPDIPLDQYINRLSSVSVYGSGSNARVQVRGADSIELDPSPLFIVDGVRVGRNFSQVYNMINMINVESIQVLRPARATQIYGGDGGFGAIVINMKR